MNVSSCHQKQCATSPQLGGHVTEPDPETHSLSRFWLRDVSAQVSCWQKHRNRARNQGNPAVTFQSMSPQSQNQRHTACRIPTEVKCHKLCVPPTFWFWGVPKSLRLIHRSIPNRWHRACLIDWHVTSCINESRNPWNQWVSWVSGSLIEMRLDSWIIHNIIILVRLNEKGPWNSAVMWQERTSVPLAPPPLMLWKARDRLVVETPGCCEPQGLEAPSAGECASTEDYGWGNSAV